MTTEYLIYDTDKGSNIAMIFDANDFFDSPEELVSFVINSYLHHTIYKFVLTPEIRDVCISYGDYTHLLFQADESGYYLRAGKYVNGSWTDVRVMFYYSTVQDEYFLTQHN
jgi:hypothetical protein